MTNRRRPGRRACAWAGTAVLVVAALALLGVVVASLDRPAVPGGHGGSGTHSGSPPSTPVVGEGLATVHDGFQLELLRRPAARGPAVPVSFRILDSRGKAVTDYDIGRTKPLHLYVLRDDMAHYQHLHPRLRGDRWHTTIAIPDGGLYRVYAEFLAEGRPDPTHPTVLGLAFVVPGDTTFRPIPPPAANVTADGGLTVSRADGAADVPVGRPTEMRFRVTDSAGRPVDRLDVYLGAYAHLSAFHTVTMGILHLHPLSQLTPGRPAGQELTFHVRFATRGEHRLFLEFSVAGRVIRAEFTVSATS